MASVILPKRFKDKLDNDQLLDGVVKTTLATFGDILVANKLYFFEEYTDHGVKHIESVLESSDYLIPDDTFNSILKVKDISYYTLSVILHDIGMHLTLDGFKLLIDGDYDNIRVEEFDKKTWKELWEDFLREAKKFSGKQLKGLFGDEHLVIRLPPINNEGEINSNDRRLIGEFIRRHHSRLGHEIAIKGFPGNETLTFAGNIQDGDRYLIGLIARSHGIDLRKSTDHIENYYGKNQKRLVHGVHVVYLMTLLRNADYLQIDVTRTSPILLKLKTFSSPTSTNEHNAHIAVNNVDLNFQDDPERIYVDASPKDSAMYLKLKKLINDIQYEFDISWAVLGELYGSTINKPQLKFKRITSNIVEAIFIDRQTYLADKFSIKANDEINKLLIAPLYGNDPSYGVRELLQNAIDACKEREVIESGYTPTINLAILEENGKHYFKITDNGIGMDVDVIRNYFLSIGSSYRKSADWQKQYVDDNGNSKVQRTGRFGIGFLAAFLIGENISVQTKKIYNTTGYCFETGINDEQINIKKDTSLKVGTTLKILISNNVLKYMDPANSSYDRISWFSWFNLRLPQINYKYLNKVIEWENRNLPTVDDKLINTWHTTNHPDFEKIIWTYNNSNFDRNFFCNGIIVKNKHFANNNSDLIINYPLISVFDYNGKLPLTLNRDSFSSTLPFQEEIKINIYKSLIAHVLNFEIDPDNLSHSMLRHPGFPDKYPNDTLFQYSNSSYTLADQQKTSAGLNEILYSTNGFILNYSFFIKKMHGIDLITIPQSSGVGIYDLYELVSSNCFLCFGNYENVPNRYDYNILYEQDYLNQPAIFYLDKETKEKLFSILNFGDTYWTYESRFDIIDISSHWMKINVNKKESNIITDSFLDKYKHHLQYIRELTLTSVSNGDPLLDDLLEKYLGDSVLIPYNINDRKAKFPLAFNELSEYMHKV